MNEKLKNFIIRFGIIGFTITGIFCLFKLAIYLISSTSKPNLELISIQNCDKKSCYDWAINNCIHIKDCLDECDIAINKTCEIK